MEWIDREVLRLTREGVWLADGEEITHEPTRRLFARSLKRRPDGWYLEIGRESKFVDVEDTAFFVHRIEGDAKAGYILVLSDETREKLDPSTLSYLPGRLVCRVHQKAHEAKFLHIPYREVLKDLKEDGSRYLLIIQGREIELAKKIPSIITQCVIYPPHHD